MLANCSEVSTTLVSSKIICVMYTPVARNVHFTDWSVVYTRWLSYCFSSLQSSFLSVSFCNQNLVPTIQALYPLLDQYYLFCKKLLIDLISAHIMLCQLLTALLKTFTTLAVKVSQLYLIYKIKVVHLSDCPLWKVSGNNLIFRHKMQYLWLSNGYAPINFMPHYPSCRLFRGIYTGSLCFCIERIHEGYGISIHHSLIPRPCPVFQLCSSACIIEKLGVVWRQGYSNHMFCFTKICTCSCTYIPCTRSLQGGGREDSLGEPSNFLASALGL